jgi:hypothetical protein
MNTFVCWFSDLLFFLFVEWMYIVNKCDNRLSVVIKANMLLCKNEHNLFRSYVCTRTA